jgi:hypothetical protein
MAARPQLPGVRWFLWVRNESLRAGILTGIYASAAFVAWLIVTNRLSVPGLFATSVDSLAGGAVAVMLVIPVISFRQEPGRLVLAGLAAWTLVTFTYLATEIHFPVFENRIGALHVFTLGAVSYGIVAVFDWVFLMCAETRQEHCRETAASAGKQRTN